MFKILTTKEFDKELNKLDKSLKIQVEKEIEQLKNKPFVGKPLGYKFFREKKVKGYRIYYLIYENFIVVYLITISNKPNQQKMINKIKFLIPYYKEEIEKRFNL